MAWIIPRARAADRTFKTTWTIVALGHSYWSRCLHGALMSAATERYRRGLNPTGRDVPTWLNKGVSGQLIAQFTARVGTDVTPFAPAAVLVSEPTNDIGTGRTPAQALTDYRALLTALLAAGVPASGIGLVNLFFHGNTFPEADIATINSYNTNIATAAAEVGAVVLDVRTPYVNRRLAGLGPITDDGVHPTVGSGAAVTNANGDQIYGGYMLGASAFV